MHNVGGCPFLGGWLLPEAQKPLLLDLFCCAGGAAAGYQAAGWRVHGIDVADQPRYVGDAFILGDAISVASFLLANPLHGYSAIHASPPCQAHSDLQKQSMRKYRDWIPETRDLCRRSGLPYIIENVEGAPLHDPVMLCGTMFEPLRVFRHRLFESNVDLVVPEHQPHTGKLCHTFDKRKAHYGAPITDATYFQVTGGGNATVAQKSAAMGIDWMTGSELNEAIPPLYTSWLGTQLRHAVYRWPMQLKQSAGEVA